MIVCIGPEKYFGMYSIVVDAVTYPEDEGTSQSTKRRVYFSPLIDYKQTGK